MNHKQYSRLVLCCLLLIGSIGYAQAQSTKNLSLDEAISLSLQNSKQLKLSQAKIDESLANLQEARERRLPDLKASGNYMRLNSPTVDLKLKTGSGNSGGGGTTENSSTPSVNEAMYALVNASIPVFSGFRINAGIESAKYLSLAAKLDAETEREEVVQNTINAYSNLYKAAAAVNLVKENLKQSQQRVTDFNNLEQNGVIARNDLLKVKLQESNIELSLLDAESNLKVAMINMNLMLGLPAETELVTDAAQFKAVTDVKPAAEWESLALQSRKDAAALDFRHKAAIAGVKAAKGEYYPSLAVTGGYIALDVPNVLVVTNALNAGAGLSYSPSTLWKTGSKVKQAKARLAQVEANQAELTDGIRIQINKAYQDYLVSRKKIDVYATALDQATENYKITKNKYDNSLATTTDLLDADVAQLQAQLNYAFAKADAVVAYNKLLQTAGTLAAGSNK